MPKLLIQIIKMVHILIFYSQIDNLPFFLIMHICINTLYKYQVNRKSSINELHNKLIINLMFDDYSILFHQNTYSIFYNTAQNIIYASTTINETLEVDFASKASIYPWSHATFHNYSS